MPDFERHFPGADEASFLALSLVNDLLHMLRQKGVLSPDEITGLLVSAADRFSQQPSAVAKRSSVFINKAMLPEHKLD